MFNSTLTYTRIAMLVATVLGGTASAAWAEELGEHPTFLQAAIFLLHGFVPPGLSEGAVEAELRYKFGDCNDNLKGCHEVISLAKRANGDPEPCMLFRTSETPLPLFPPPWNAVQPQNQRFSNKLFYNFRQIADASAAYLRWHTPPLFGSRIYDGFEVPAKTGGELGEDNGVCTVLKDPTGQACSPYFIVAQYNAGDIILRRLNALRYIQANYCPGLSGTGRAF